MAVSESGGVFLVFEHCDKDLAAILDDYYAKHKSSPFSEASVKRLFLQLLSALEYLHDHHLIHRDVSKLKEEMLLITNSLGCSSHMKRFFFLFHTSSSSLAKAQ